MLGYMPLMCWSVKPVRPPMRGEEMPRRNTVDQAKWAIAWASLILRVQNAWIVGRGLSLTKDEVTTLREGVMLLAKREEKS